jgi:hypothetical protein
VYGGVEAYYHEEGTMKVSRNVWMGGGARWRGLVAPWGLVILEKAGVPMVRLVILEKRRGVNV